MLTNIAFAVLLIAFDRGFRLEDAGTFEKAAEVVGYAGERLSALRAGAEAPDTPELFADVEGLKLGFLTTFVLHIGVVGAVLWGTGQTPSKLAQAFRLDDYSFTDLWLPGLVTIGAYGGVIGYSILAEVVDIDLLRPQSTVPDAVTRDKVALVLAGVLAVGTAPIAEEVFFRGFIFSGLRKYGFFVAASVSGVLFTLA
ncbi:MAG: CPBP family intramembrane glutamic endopeptidase, partial [Dehalococcoidia bacterium]